MKFATVAITALAGSALASPDWTQPGGDHEYKAISRRFVPGTEDSLQLEKRVGPVGLAVGGVLAAAALGFVGGPVAVRVMNSVYGVQKKRAINANDLTFKQASAIYINNLADVIAREHPYDGNDAGVCVGVGYKLSNNTARVDGSSFKFFADGQEHEYDCFVLQGPATLEVAPNATDADIAFTAPHTSTWVNNKLTLTE